MKTADIQFDADRGFLTFSNLSSGDAELKPAATKRVKRYRTTVKMPPSQLGFAITNMRSRRKAASIRKKMKKAKLSKK